VPSIVDLPLALIWGSLALHLVGEHRAAIKLAEPRSTAARWRAAAFYAGLLTIFLALATPIDSLARKLFWVHMTQHVLLLGVAAPLIALGAPWNSTWRGLPLRWRRKIARAVARSSRLAGLRFAARVLARPRQAWLAFNVNLIFWHVPFAYDLTLRNPGAHALEHILFVASGVLLWSQVLHSPPLRLRLSLVGRVYYTVSATAVGWLLSLVLAFAPTALYPAYAHLAHRPGGISELTDQHIAAGVMLGPGSLAATLFVFLGLYRWLGQDDERAPAPRTEYA
jgi:cytochrome c oxidase assembly factor CtaG